MTKTEGQTFRIMDLANPTRFLALLDKIMLPLAILTIIILGIGLYMALVVSPDDYQQGATVKIMYIHVPAAWLAMFAYTMMTIAAFGTLVWKHPLADVSAKAAAPLGAAFTFVCLTTGSFWGKPMWGTWWVWDARLTSMLILLIIYLGLMALWRAIEDPIRAGKSVAILTLVGFVIIPIIKFSVDWWSTLHQPASVFTLEGPKMANSMLVPLLVMAVAFTLLFTLLHFKAMKNEILRRRIRSMQMQAARRVASGNRATASQTATPAASHSAPQQ
ncbi:heme ABC transporter permease [uncultured Cohaesibacter sp.]|uniref:heme ABC transporter permease n=1 Tax=uncultured Cohaesibacter sp. TaxID=1002546 RepID=UPI0029C89363|nr:heme ABC transporter permease [uncultured Cohaesibacter sp.]